MLIIYFIALFTGLYANNNNYFKKMINDIKYKIEYKHDPPKKYILDEDTPELIKALEYANLAQAKEIINKKNNEVNIQDKNGLTPLYIASIRGYTEIVKLLLNNNANPNIREINGRTPLLEAASNGYTEIVKILIEGGVDAYSRCKIGYSPLISATTEGYYDIVKFFCDKRSHVDEHIDGI